MAKTVHNKKARMEDLYSLISAVSGLPLGAPAWQLSDVKQDGTVFVRFRSLEDHPASTITDRVESGLFDRGYEFTRTDDNKLRVRLP